MSDSVGRKKQSAPTGTTQGITREKGDSSSETSLYRSSADESVRYKGRKPSSVYMASKKYFEYSCDLCHTAGDHVRAEGFCIRCDDYLCGMCFKSHSRNRLSRNHVLLDKENMPKKYKFCDQCKTVGDEEEAVGYCTDCGEYLCSDCFKRHSRKIASRHHVLLDKDDMPGWTDSDLTSSVAKITISGRDADSQQYNEEYTYIRDINIKADKDKEDCYITGMTLVTRTELILADNKNNSLKLIDLENNVIKDSLRLHTFPNGPTTISKDQVAVVLAKTCKIQIISVSRGLSVVRTLNTNGNCVDIKCINKKLYVSFKKSVKFQILQLTGAVYKTINPDSEVLRHFTRPCYIAVSPDESMIYMSDWKTNKVMCMDMYGRMMSMYQGELNEPYDITISPFGSVYLCNRYQYVVYKMTSDLSDVTVILGREDGLVAPQAMCFNADKQHLYISSGNIHGRYRNALKLYKWK